MPLIYELYYIKNFRYNKEKFPFRLLYHIKVWL